VLGSGFAFADQPLALRLIHVSSITHASATAAR
jgi:hypothetical protein